jgi:lipid-A-disaccharide synthase
MPNSERRSTSILLLAGDVSGDVHSAALARALLTHDPRRALHAIGGIRLREAVADSTGGTYIADSTNCSAIGILSAAQVYIRCWFIRERLRDFLRNNRVDLAVACDWGAFNGRVLPELHAAGIPVLYYFPPGSWKRSGGGLGIVPYVKRVATPFRWSAECLRAAGCDAEWVGHAALERVRPQTDRAAVRRQFGIGENEKVLALLPGSRCSEIDVLGPTLAAAEALLQKTHRLRSIAVVPRELVDRARKFLPESIGIVTDCASDLLLACDVAIVKTGTATLEAALARAPHIAVYDVSWTRHIEWALLWAWRRIPFIAMPNIILQRKAYPELLGAKCTPENIASEIRRLLDDPAACAEMARAAEHVREELGVGLPFTATERTAQIVEEMLADAASSRTATATAGA